MPRITGKSIQNTYIGIGRINRLAAIDVREVQMNARLNELHTEYKTERNALKKIARNVKRSA